jgi:hypothetical protein
MYNTATQVQVPIDAYVGCISSKNKIVVGASACLSKKEAIAHLLFLCLILSSRLKVGGK